MPLKAEISLNPLVTVKRVLKTQFLLNCTGHSLDPIWIMVHFATEKSMQIFKK